MTADKRKVSSECYSSQPPDDELPAELPVGTTACGGLYVFMSAAKLVSKTCYTAEHWAFGKGLSKTTDSRGGWGPEEIDWTSVPRPPKPAPAEIPFKVGDWVRIKQGIECCHESYWGTLATVIPRMAGATERDVSLRMAVDGAALWFDRDELERLVRAQPAPAPAGSVDAAHRETAGGSASAQPGATSTQPPDPGSYTDPRTGAEYDVAAWGIVADSVRAAKRYGPECKKCGQETTHVGFDGEAHCADCQCMVADEIIGKGKPAPLDERIAKGRVETEQAWTAWESPTWSEP